MTLGRPPEHMPPALPEADPRARDVQHVTLQLVEAYAFNEAHAVLSLHLRETADRQRSHSEDLFIAWSRIDQDHRPDFLTYAHHRRRIDLAPPTKE